MEIQLTAKEFNLLYFLASHSGQVFSHNQIYNEIYEMTECIEGIDNIVYCLVRNLRKKLRIDLKIYKYIHTVRGVGYKFEMDWFNRKNGSILSFVYILLNFDVHQECISSEGVVKLFLP